MITITNKTAKLHIDVKNSPSPTFKTTVGVPGRTPELKVESNTLYWKYKDSSDWIALTTFPTDTDFSDKVDISSIVDELNSTSTDAPLSANQGRVLNDLIANINNTLASNDQTLDTFQEIVDYIKQTRNSLDSLNVNDVAGLSSSLNTKVDKVSDKQLSTEDYTTAEKTKLANLSTNAEENAVDSVAGKTGDVVLDTDDISEGTNNLYYSDSRARNAINAIGDLSYNSTTGEISFSETYNTASQIKTAYESNADTNAFTDSEKTKLTSVEYQAQKNIVDSVNSQTGDVVLDTGDISENGNLYFTDSRSRNAISVSGDLNYDPSTGIVSFSETYSTPQSIKTAYESNNDTNAYTDSEKSKLNDIEPEATADQTDAEIKTAYESNTDTNAFTDSEKTKLTSVEYQAQKNDVNSVAGYTGDVVLGTDDISEGINNLYYTDSRVRNAVSVSGDLSYNPNTGVISFSETYSNPSQIKAAYETNIDTNAYTDSEKDKLSNIEQNAEVNAVDSVAGKTGVVSLDTGDVSENGNLYFTDSRARNAISASGDVNYDPNTGIISFSETYRTDAEIKTAYESNADTNAFTDIEQTKLSNIEQNANNYSHPDHTGHVSSDGDGNTVINTGVIIESMFDNAIVDKLNQTSPNNYNASVDPTATDDSDSGWSLGSVWINTDTNEAFRCVDDTPGSAVWINTTLTSDELGTIATQDSSNVTITGGTISGISDIAVEDGGTGASNASGARTNLGLVIGTDVQAYNTILDNTTASFTTTLKTKLDNIEQDAQVNVVDSVNSQTGAVVLGTDDISEGTNNLYFTDSRARNAVSASGDISYDNVTGTFTFSETYKTPFQIKTAYESNADTNAFTDSEKDKLSNIEAEAEVNTVNSVAGYTGSVSLETDDISEGTNNLYFTDSRARNAVSVSGDLSYNPNTGVISFSETYKTAQNIKTAYESNSNTNAYTDSEKDKLFGIEENATADQTDAEIKTAYESNADTNAFTDSEKSKLDSIQAGAENNAVDSVNNQTGDVSLTTTNIPEGINNLYYLNSRARNAISSSGDIHYNPATGIISFLETYSTASELKNAYESNSNTNAYTDADMNKLEGIESGATADQTDVEIKTAYESNADTNAFTDSEKTKLSNIEQAATADQTDAEIKTAYESNADTNAFTDSEKSRLANLGNVPNEDATDMDNWDQKGASHDDVIIWNQNTNNWEPSSFESGTLVKTFVEGEQATITLNRSLVSPVVSVEKEVPQTGITNNRWNTALSEESMDIQTPESYNADLSFTSKNDLVSSSYTGNSFDVNLEDSNPISIHFKPDGTKFYITGLSNDLIYEYNVSTPWDISSSSYSGNSLSISSSLTAASPLYIKPDGTKLFIVDNSGNIQEYTLSTPWDITTATYVVDGYIGYSSNARGMFFKSDGTRMYVVDYNNDFIYEFTLRVPWSIDTLSGRGNRIDISVFGHTSPHDLYIDDDGEYAYIVHDDKVFEYMFYSSWDTKTLTYTGRNYTINEDSNCHGIHFSPDGTKFYIVGNSNAIIYEYDIGQKADSRLSLSSGSFAQTDVTKKIVTNDGAEFVLLNTKGDFLELISPQSYNSILSNDWDFLSGELSTTGVDLFQSSDVIHSISDSRIEMNKSINFDSNDFGTFAGTSFKPDGTKFYGLDQTNDNVQEYDISTPWDIATLQMESRKSFDISNEQSSPNSLYFKPDGAKFYIGGTNPSDIQEYNLSTPWDITTASVGDSFSIGATTWRELTFKPDGARFYIAFYNGSTWYISEYNLSTPWDITTASSGNDSNWATIGSDSPSSLVFKEDGITLFVDDGDLYELNLPTPWDITTAEQINTNLANPDGSYMFLSPNETKLYTAGNNTLREYVSSDKIYQINDYVSIVNKQPYQIDSTYWTDINDITLSETVNHGHLFYSFSLDNKNTFSILREGNDKRDIVRNNSGTWEYNNSGSYSAESWTPSTVNEAKNAISEAITHKGNVGAGFDSPLHNISQFEYNSGNFDISNEETAPQGFYFKPDGTKFYLIGNNNDEIHEYDLSTPWDITSASYTNNSFSVASQEGSPTAIFFKPDGTRFYIVGISNDSVYEYDCSTAWDITSASYTNNSFSVASQEGSPTAIFFKPDGTRFYISGNSGGIYEYSLTNPWDISSSVDHTASSGNLPTDGPLYSMHIRNDGRKLWIGDTYGTIIEYTMNSPWDISNSFFSGYVSSASSEVSQFRDISLNPDGIKLYVLTENENRVFEYDSINLTYPNIMHGYTLDNFSDSEYFSLGNSIDICVSVKSNSNDESEQPSVTGMEIDYDANTLNKGALHGTDYEWDHPESNKVRVKALSNENFKIRVV